MGEEPKEYVMSSNRRSKMNSKLRGHMIDLSVRSQQPDKRSGGNSNATPQVSPPSIGTPSIGSPSIGSLPASGKESGLTAQSRH